MSKKFTLRPVISYKDIDRSETLLLSSLLKFFQDAAIGHANQFDLGASTIFARGESWVLNRMALALQRYPRFEEPIQVETWCSRAQGCRGYRDYRLFRRDELLVSASSLWLYVNLKTKSLTRIPLEMAAKLPFLETEVYEPFLDGLTITPLKITADAFTIPLRYSDFDGNGHVNNTAYVDFLQTALLSAGLSPKPTLLKIKFIKEIRPETRAVTVKLETRGEETVFSISDEGAYFAEGTLGGTVENGT